MEFLVGLIAFILIGLIFFGYMVLCDKFKIPQIIPIGIIFFGIILIMFLTATGHLILNLIQ